MNQKTPYTKTYWIDEIIDIETNETIQKGTKFTASRANNIEDGIYRAHQGIESLRDVTQKLRVQIDMIGRAPVNNGTFFDTLDGEVPKQLNRLNKRAVALNSVSAGAVNIPTSEHSLQTGDTVTIYDDVTSEVVSISSVAVDSVTVNSLSNSYKKGAVLAQSNTFDNTARQRLLFGTWGTYDITISEVN